MHNIYKTIKYFSIFILILPIKVFSFKNDKINFGKFLLHKYEVTINEFNNARRYLSLLGITNPVISMIFPEDNEKLFPRDTSGLTINSLSKSIF